jgi:hypothetical protein
MSEFDRRSLFKFAGKIATGVAAGEMYIRTAPHINDSASNITGLNVGNAAYNERIDASLLASEERKKETQMQFKAIVVAPIVEETSFRALPSALVSKREGSADATQDVLQGVGGTSMTRRELGVGFVSSMLFGAAHNITNKGINTDTIPAAQTYLGAINWYLQRKLGLFTSITSHAMVNARILLSK